MMDNGTTKIGKKIITSRLSTIRSITSAITAIIVCVGLFLWLNSLNLRLVNSVIRGCPNAFPDITYEEAFGQFYSNPKWENGSTGDTKIVRFTGNCIYNGAEAKVVLNFWVDNKFFSLHDGTINGNTVNIIELNGLHNRPFLDYKKK